MAKPLSDQIKAALGPDARATTVACLIHDVRLAVKDAGFERDRCHAIAVSADSDDETADAAADAEIKASRKVDRLVAQLAQVEARHAELEKAARLKREHDQLEQLTDERDALVTDLKTRWPVLAAEMAALVERIVEIEPRCNAARIAGPENLARGVPASFCGPAGTVPRLVEMDIAGLDSSGKLLRTGNKFWATGAWS